MVGAYGAYGAAGWGQPDGGYGSRKLLILCLISLIIQSNLLLFDLC